MFGGACIEEIHKGFISKILTKIRFIHGEREELVVLLLPGETQLYIRHGENGEVESNNGVTELQNLPHDAEQGVEQGVKDL